MNINEIVVELDKLSKQDEYKNLRTVEFMHLVYVELLNVREGKQWKTI